MSKIWTANLCITMMYVGAWIGTLVEKHYYTKPCPKCESCPEIVHRQDGEYVIQPVFSPPPFNPMPGEVAKIGDTLQIFDGTSWVLLGHRDITGGAVQPFRMIQPKAQKPDIPLKQKGL